MTGTGGSQEHAEVAEYCEIAFRDIDLQMPFPKLSVYKYSSSSLIRDPLTESPLTYTQSSSKALPLSSIQPPVPIPNMSSSALSQSTPTLTPDQHASFARDGYLILR